MIQRIYDLGLAAFLVLLCSAIGSGLAGQESAANWLGATACILACVVVVADAHISSKWEVEA